MIAQSLRKIAMVAVPVVIGFAAPANAALTVFQTFSGSYGLSTDGGGSTSTGYVVNAFVPVGATVTAAYLYQATNNTTAVQGVTMNGSAVTFGPRSGNATACCSLASARADVTSLVASVVNGGAGGTYAFNIGEANSGLTDGTALVVVYSLASLATQTVAILDGFASAAGDTATVSFSTPLNPSAPGFVADLRLGIGFSAENQNPVQSSTVRVNGTLISSNAGGNDDGQLANGALITVGGNDDPFSPFNPTYAQDHERYDLSPYITTGSTSLTFATANASLDDNIFLAALLISGNATVTSGVPEPATWAMMIAGFGMIGGTMRRRKVTARVRYA